MKSSPLAQWIVRRSLKKRPVATITTIEGKRHYTPRPGQSPAEYAAEKDDMTTTSRGSEAIPQIKLREWPDLWIGMARVDLGKCLRRLASRIDGGPRG